MLCAARRQPAADDGRADAEQSVDDRRAGMKLQARCDAWEIAAAQVAGKHAQAERRERGA